MHYNTKYTFIQQKTTMKKQIDFGKKFNSRLLTGVSFGDIFALEIFSEPLLGVTLGLLALMS